jgi:hypothetical protein
LCLGQFPGYSQVRVKAGIGLRLPRGWIDPSNRANPTDVDPLPIQAVAFAIDSLNLHADGRESLDQLRFRVSSQVVVAHAVRL